MGVNVDVKEFFQSFETHLQTSLQQSGSSSSVANCNVVIGSINFKSSTNCSVVIENRCVATAQVALQSIISALTSSFNSMSSQQQSSIAALTAGVNVGVQTTSQNFVQTMTTLINQRCSATSVVNSNFTLGKLEFGECKNLLGSTTIKFINTGHAQSNCAMKIINDLQIQGTNSTQSGQSSTFGGLLQFFNTIFGFIRTFWAYILGFVLIIIGIPLLIGVISRMSKKIKREDAKSSEMSETVQALAVETLKHEPLHWSLYTKFIE